MEKEEEEAGSCRLESSRETPRFKETPRKELVWTSRQQRSTGKIQQLKYICLQIFIDSFKKEQLKLLKFIYMCVSNYTNLLPQTLRLNEAEIKQYPIESSQKNHRRINIYRSKVINSLSQPIKFYSQNPLFAPKKENQSSQEGSLGEKGQAYIAID